MLVMALGVTMTIKGHRLGIGPWDVLHVGLFKKFGLTIGTWSILLGLTISANNSDYSQRVTQNRHMAQYALNWFIYRYVQLDNPRN